MISIESPDISRQAQADVEGEEGGRIDQNAGEQQIGGRIEERDRT